MFKTLTDSIAADTLPYVLDKIDYVRYSDYKLLPDTSAARLMGSAGPDSRYYIVSKPIANDSFTALITLESRVDTTFNTHEHFQLVTYSAEGAIIGRCTIGEAYYDESFFKAIGSINLTNDGEWLVIVETYMSEMVDGEWHQISFPTEVKQYRLDASGHIRHIKTTRNSLENEPVDLS